MIGKRSAPPYVSTRSSPLLCRLSPWSRPPSISPSSFCCSLNGRSLWDHEVIPSQPNITSSPAPSPVLYLATMGQLSYIFYIYLKANATRTALKSAKALEQINAVKSGLPLHLSENFPANHDDARWESQHPWIAVQRHQLAIVLDFMILSISRSLAIGGAQSERPKNRSMAADAARRILLSFNAALPRFHEIAVVICSFCSSIWDLLGH